VRIFADVLVLVQVYVGTNSRSVGGGGNKALGNSTSSLEGVTVPHSSDDGVLPVTAPCCGGGAVLLDCSVTLSHLWNSCTQLLHVVAVCNHWHFKEGRCYRTWK
jgi:hypothetical protein